MLRCWRRWGLFPLALTMASIWFPRVSQADIRVAPEASVYVTHSSIFRSRFATGATWLEEKGEFTTGSFEYDLDIGLASFFRRYVFKDPNPEKSKRVSFRLGYAYLPDLTENRNVDERRTIAEATFRFPMGNAWLLSDRNRGEMRNQNHSDWGRYRNRLRMERNVAISRFRMTPYTNAEVYYDGKLDEWNQLDTTLGSEFPWYYSTILEVFFTYQFVQDGTDHQTFGVTLQKHL